MSEKKSKKLTDKGQKKTFDASKRPKYKKLKPEAGYPNGQNPSFLAAQAKPGQVLNPKGRPKGKPSLIEKLNKYLKRPAMSSSKEMKQLCKDLELDNNSDVAEVIMAAFVHKTINSQNSGFMTEFMNRMLGKVPEQAQIASEDIVKDVQEAIAQMQGLGAPDEVDSIDEKQEDTVDDVQDYIDDMGTVEDEETHHND